MGSNLLFIGQFPPPIHGLSKINVALASHLSAAGAKVGTFNTAPDPMAGRVFGQIGRIKKVLQASLFLLYRSIKLDRPTVYLSGEAGLGNLFLILFSMLCRIFRLKIFVHHHNYSYIKRKSFLMVLLIFVASKALNHVFLCSDMRDKFSDTYLNKSRKANCIIVSNAAFIDKIGDDRPVEIEGTVLRIGTLANLSFEKGIDTFVDLLDELIASGICVEGRIAGPANSEQVNRYLLERISERPGKLSWIGPVHGNDKETFYKEIDIFVFPTRYSSEAQPLVLLEALSNGCPILASDIACISCDHHDTPGRVFPLEEFIGCATEWLRSSSIREIRSLRKQSIERSSVMRRLGGNQLDELVRLLVTES